MLANGEYKTQVFSRFATPDTRETRPLGLPKPAEDTNKMIKLLVTESGRLRKADDVELAEKIADLRKNKDPWVVIDELVKAWEKTRPEEEKAYVIQVKDRKELLADAKFGQTEQGQHFDRRLTVLFPFRLMKLIRTQYKDDELPMDSNFFEEFVRRYPKALIPEKM